MMQASLSRLDRSVGAGVERLVVSHHRRRLARIGWLGALDAQPGDLAAEVQPPRGGNPVEIPEFKLRSDGSGLRDALARVADRADVRMIAWAGSPLPLFQPDRKQAREMRDELVRGPGGDPGGLAAARGTLGPVADRPPLPGDSR